MNNRKDFIQWLTKIKGLSPKEQKSLMWKIDSLNRAKKVFETTDAEIIKSYGDGSLNLYIEFLSQTEQGTVIVESEEMSDNKIPTAEISLSEEQINILENDYEKKKSSAKEMQKNTFDRLSEIIGTFENIGSDKYSLEKKNTEQNLKNSLYVFDIVNGRFSDLNNGVSNNAMETYVKYDTKFYPRKDNAFYYGKSMQRQIGCMNAFEKNLLEREPNILSKSIEAQLKYGNDSKNICLVPDTLGDFKDSIKGELKGFGKAILQIPRSIAAIYSLIDFENIDDDCSYCIYDFDCGNPCRTDIRIQYDCDAEEYVVIRMGRWLLSTKTCGTYPQLVRLYIENYCKKYGIIIPDNCITNMIATRDILRVWIEQKAIMVETDDGFKELKYDKEIVETIKNEIISKINVHDNKDKYFVLFNFNSTDNAFINLSGLESGCKNILSRIKNKKIIWKEYLPKLELEVIRDGKFDTLKLISDEHIQSITASSMDEEVDIKVDNGIFTFPSNRDKILCPLTREEFGDKTRDKMAMFYNPKILPLLKPTDVTISLKYRYGDPDSYKLFATPLNGEFQEISSQWCDEKDRIMGNDKIPNYAPKPIEMKKINVDEIVKDLEENLSKKWYYFQLNNSFKSPNEWKLLKPININKFALQRYYSDKSNSDLSYSDVNLIEKIINYLIKLYKDADEGTLNYGEFDFEKKYLDGIKNNIVNNLSFFGGALDKIDYDIAEEMAHVVLKHNDIQYILQLSTYISREDDLFGIWDKIDQKLQKSSLKKAERATRTIGTVCWRSEKWIESFSKCPEYVIKLVIDKAIEICNVAKTDIPNKNKYNSRVLRDALEALLGITRLKKTNSSVRNQLDCNEESVKEFVVLLKDIDEIIKQYIDNLDSKRPFVSRLEMKKNDELCNVSSVVYPLIEILTDGNAVQLTAFKDIDEEE